MNINDIIKQRYPFEPTKKIADDLNLTLSQVYNRAFAMRIKKDPVYLRSTQFPAGYLGGKATQFQRGHVPANKGYKMSKEVYEKAKPTMFKKRQPSIQYATGWNHKQAPRYKWQILFLY